MTSKKATLLKIIQLSVAHVAMIVVFIYGYDQAYAMFQAFASYAGSSSQEIFTSAKKIYFQVMSLEKPILFGSLFIAGLIAYDIVSLAQWFSSFSFTQTKRCKKCERKLVREPRQPIDRFVSYLVPLKRYRCIACNDEYLMFKNKTGQKLAKRSKVMQPAPIKKSEN